MRRERAFDLDERTFEFGVRVVRMVNTLPRVAAAPEIIRQIVRSSTSIGANLEEARGAESHADFSHKLSVAYKEARETRYWLRVIQASLLDVPEVVALIQESDELVRILSKSIHTARGRHSAQTASEIDH